jgi:hypothetical protein
MYLYWQSHPRIEGSVTHQRLRLSRGDDEEQAAGIQMSDGIRGSMRDYRRRERGKKGVEDLQRP